MAAKTDDRTFGGRRDSTRQHLAVNIRMFMTLYWLGLGRTVGLLGPKGGGASDF
jgi:hypothetical protein